MQGRLLPPVDGRLQSFPVDRWPEEFALAAEAGLDRIEWIYEWGTAEANPLASPAGLQRLRQLARASSVEVRSICADWFMRAPLVVGGRFDETAAARLRWLVPRCADLGAAYLVLPFVDESALHGPADVTALVAGVARLLRETEPYAVELHFETSLAPPEFAALLAQLDHPLVRANYDIGNSASLGFDPRVELAAIGARLGSVHVKDRRKHGGSVLLGTGDADFAAVFDELAHLDYAGPFILQAARDPRRSEVELARANRAFLSEGWAAARALRT